MQVDLEHLVLVEFFARRVLSPVHAGVDLETFRFRAANQAEHAFITVERIALPVLADRAKQAVLDRVPLAGPLGIMTNQDPESGHVDESGLQRVLPQVNPAAIAAAAV